MSGQPQADPNQCGDFSFVFHGPGVSSRNREGTATASAILLFETPIVVVNHGCRQRAKPERWVALLQPMIGTKASMPQWATLWNCWCVGTSGRRRIGGSRRDPLNEELVVSIGAATR
jgi:hypothetical protein